MIREMLDGAARRLKAGAFDADPDMDVGLRVSTAAIYREIAELDSARELLEPALATAERVAPARGSLGLASALAEWGSWLLDVGKPADAVAPLERALAMRRRLVFGDDPDVARDSLRLASAYYATDDPASALGPAEEALAMLVRLGDEEKIAVARRRLALSFHALGRLREAEDLDRRALETFRAKYPEGHPETLSALNDLAGVLHSLGRFDEASDLLAQAVAVGRKVFPADHPRLANAITNLGCDRADRGDDERAVPLLQEALDMRRRLYSAYHPHVAETLEILARSLYRIGRVDEAEARLREMVDLVDSEPTAAREDAIAGYLGLGRILHDRGLLAEAETALLDAWSRRPARPDGRIDEVIVALAAVNEDWEAKEPGRGHAERAAEWRTRRNAEAARPPR